MSIYWLIILTIIGFYIGFMFAGASLKVSAKKDSEMNKLKHGFKIKLGSHRFSLRWGVEDE